VKVRFTPTARRQFLEAVGYILRENPEAASALRARAARGLKRLERFPQSGRPLPEFPNLPCREVLVNPYRFFYTVRSKVVWVVAVWHGAQLPYSPGENVNGRAPR
jgi:toxin ParE1/3/4